MLICDGKCFDLAYTRGIRGIYTRKSRPVQKLLHVYLITVSSKNKEDCAREQCYCIGFSDLNEQFFASPIVGSVWGEGNRILKSLICNTSYMY